MHVHVFDKVTHRAVAGHGRAVFLAIEAVDQIEEDLGFEVGHLQPVDVVAEQVVRLAS
jgi:hypothetical protein